MFARIGFDLEDLTMRFCFTFAVLCAISSGTVFGNDAAEPKSVLVNKTEPTPAVSAPATIVQSATPCKGAGCQSQVVCVDGRCARLYNVESDSYETCRNRLFGGTVVRKGSRTVYRPARR